MCTIVGKGYQALDEIDRINQELDEIGTRRIHLIQRRQKLKQDLYHLGLMGHRVRSRVEKRRALRLRIFERDGWRCLHCGSFRNLTLDHIKPKARGGKGSYSNLQTLCKRCNHAKGDYTIDYRTRDYREAGQRSYMQLR